MKITQQEPTPPPFKPVVITLETQEEVENLRYLLYNFMTANPDRICFMNTSLKMLRDATTISH